MYSKQQASHLRQEFWTTFGRYMQPVLSSAGEKVNWINYKTGAKYIYFKMDAGKGATIAIELRHPDTITRISYYKKLRELHLVFLETVSEEWNWQEEIKDENGNAISRVYTELAGVNIFNKEDWPALISFFKPRIIALDAFWNEVKYAFDVW